MSGAAPPSIWAALEEATATLPEPFSRAALLRWVEKRRPDVETSSISTHIQYAIAETPHRDAHYLGTREPLLTRVDRGLYRRYRRSSGERVDVPAGTRTQAPATASAQPVAPATSVPTADVILVGCSSRKAPTALPARDLFRGDSFERARDRAIGMGVPWFVLSAKFGLLLPDDVIGPYDVYLGKQPAAYRAAWGEWVVAQLAVQLPLGGAHVEIHAGDAYCSPLRGPLQGLGATVTEPLAGLRQGERLAWPGYRDVPEKAVAAERDVPDVDVLLDPATTVSPAQFLEAGPDGRRSPGLYAWWVDEVGAEELTAGMGHPVGQGLLYVGKAGGHRPSAEPSSSTLWGRVAGNHLRGNVRGSTLRKSLAAILGASGGPISEADLTTWMHVHLRVAVLPVPSERVGALEDELVARADPPLNLAGAERGAARSALTRLRGLLSQPAVSRAQRPASVPTGSVGTVRAFENRVRSDVVAMVRSGYRPMIFLQMLAERSAMGAARQLLAAPTMSDGFRYLWEHGMLRHSVESAVLEDAFAHLFTEEERDGARQRLRDAGYF